MSYATLSDLIERYGRDELVQITDRADPAAGDLDETAIARALDDADAEINSYLAARVTTPVSPVPRALVAKACAIARYLLWKDRASERVREDYKDAVEWLRKVALGLVTLGDTSAPTEPAAALTPKFSEVRRTFSKDSLKEF